MNLFNSLFGNSNDSENKESNVEWIALENISQLNEIKVKSEEKPVLIFKHSTRCSVSRMALKQFEQNFELKAQIDTYFLDLIAHRDISNQIAIDFLVEHQSPQILLIKGNKTIHNASHSDIDALELNDFL